MFARAWSYFPLARHPAADFPWSALARFASENQCISV